MNKFFVRVGERALDHFDSLGDAKARASDLIRQGEEVYIDQYAVAPSGPCPVITYCHDSEILDWVQSMRH